MGNKVTIFSEEQLESYQDCTFFTRKEILRIFRRFRELSPKRVPGNMKEGRAKKVKIPYPEMEIMTELRENPFCERICQVFSEDGSGDMNFDDFLDMFSVFSEAAPRDIKCAYAFKIYDFDGDNYLGRYDLQQTLSCLTRNELTDEEITFVIDKREFYDLCSIHGVTCFSNHGRQVLEEADLDDDNMLSYIEFEHVISRSPDFLKPHCVIVIGEQHYAMLIRIYCAIETRPHHVIVKRTITNRQHCVTVNRLTLCNSDEVTLGNQDRPQCVLEIRPYSVISEFTTLGHVMPL